MNTETEANKKMPIEKTGDILNMNKRFSISFPFMKRFNFHKDEKSSAENVNFPSDSHIFSKR